MNYFLSFSLSSESLQFEEKMSQKKILLVGECVLDIIQEVGKYPGEDDDIR